MTGYATSSIIRWEPTASSDILRKSSRCTNCSGKCVTLIQPSWQDMQVGTTPFPVERMGHRG